MTLELSFEIPYCGQLLVIAVQAAGTAPVGGFDQLVIINNLTGTPILYRNGTAVTLYGPIWNDGTNGNTQSSAVVFYYLSAGPVLPSDVMTVTIPLNFINGASSAYTATTVTNYTGSIEGPFGHMPGLNGTPTTGAGCNLGQPSIDYTCANYLPANQMFRSGGYFGTPGLTVDQFNYPISWTATSALHTRFYGPSGTNDLDNRGWPNEIGTWSIIWPDAAIGTTGLTTTVTPVMGGDSPNGTLSIGSPSVVGNVTILPFTVGYNTSSPSSWYVDLAVNITAPANNLGGSDGLAHWALGKGPFIVPPNSADGTQISAAFLNQLLTNPYKINPNVKAQLTGGNRVANHLRAMESIQGSGGEANWIYTVDMPDARNASWEYNPGTRTISATFQFIRAVITNPSDPTHSWSSIKCYGPQSCFALSDGVTTPVTATLTSGSLNIVITNATFPAIMAGGFITGTGIPANTRLAYFNTSTGVGVLTNPATASGSQSLTMSNPGYVPLSTTDNGGFMVNGNGQGAYVAVEMRSTLPHGLTTWHNPSTNSTTNHNAIPVTNYVGNYDPGQPNSPVYVTGPYTIAMVFYIATTGSTVQAVNSTTELNFTSTGGWTVSVDIPFQNTGTMPPEALVAMCVDLGCPQVIVTLPGWGVDELYTQIGTRCAGQANGTIQVIGERVDEPWDAGPGGFSQLVLANFGLLNLYDSLPNNTVVYPNFTTNSSVPLTNFGYIALGPHVLYSGRALSLFKSAWVAAGKPAANVKHLINAQWGNALSAQTELGAAQQWQVPADYLAIAPYMQIPFTNSIINAINASGGNLSLAAINDLNRLLYVWDQANQSQYQQHQAVIQAWGQPSQPLSCQESMVASGNIPGGGHVCSSTWLDSAGNETTVGQSTSSSFGTGTVPGNYIQVQMPATPAWVKTVNLFTSVSSYTDQRLAVQVTTVAFGGTTQPGTLVNITVMPAGTAHTPPLTNGVPSSSAGNPPILCSYEGGDVLPVPPNVTNFVAIMHDVQAHPSRWLNIYTWYMSTQIGCQWSPGSGMAFATWYGGWAGPGPAFPSRSYWYEFLIYAGAGQPAGRGLPNRYATTKPGATGPGDGQDHNGGWPPAIAPPGAQVRNECPGGYGLQQWIAGGVSPTPTPSPTATTIARRFVSRRG